MQFTLDELCQQLGGKISGVGDIKISGVASLDGARAGEISFADNIRQLEKAQNSQADALVVAPDFPHCPSKNLIRIDKPRHAFVRIMKLFEQKPQLQPGIHPSAAIAEHGVELGERIAIAEHCVIRNDVSIGNRTCIESGVHVGVGVKIGEDCWVGPNVTLMHGTQIGDRVTLHAGSVIGGDGFGYLWAGHGHEKIPQLGTVQIDDDVEIGCNVCIDRATFGKTHIRQGSKIDNQVQIAHNNDIGKHCIIVSQVGISGSVTLGKRVTLAGQVGVADHVRIGDGATVGAAAGVTKDIKPGEVVWGTPARPMKKTLKELASLAKLPDLKRQVKKLSERLKALEQRLDEKE
ncbi:MAG: UDP-3-O-(3-hydroxymyristoyl)glucosamine N-acyltransferase [Pseudomonadota bacterium]